MIKTASIDIYCIVVAPPGTQATQKRRSRSGGLCFLSGLSSLLHDHSLSDPSTWVSCSKYFHGPWRKPIEQKSRQSGEKVDPSLPSNDIGTLKPCSILNLDLTYVHTIFMFVDIMLFPGPWFSLWKSGTFRGRSCSATGSKCAGLEGSAN